MVAISTFLAQSWPYVIAIIDVVLALVISAHVVLYKRDVRAAIGWAGLVWLAPIIGATLYGIFGINRIRRRASRLRDSPAGGDGGEITSLPLGADPDSTDAIEFRQRTPHHLVVLSDHGTQVAGIPLAYGNTVQPLVNGDQAFPAMLESIHNAAHSVALCTYIFDDDRAGTLFVKALIEAVGRGVEVRVLVDGAGARYSRPPVRRVLKRGGVRVAEFLKSFVPWRNAYLNLRNHRKLLIVDGRVGFTGGLNIREGCLLELDPEHPVQDVHFRIDGPVVRQLMTAFAADWMFTTDERLEGERWYPAIAARGEVAARGIQGGPDEDFESIRWTLLGALTRAQESVRITTPYFLPDQTLITALNLTAMRGVTVDIVVPEVSNLRFVQWASTAQAWQVLERGCRIWLSKPPFDHSKLMVIDSGWTFLGSANWDPRSLRLNFEYNLECYDWELAEKADELIEKKKRHGRRLTLDEVNRRSLPVRLRDGVTRLFSPYL